MHSARRFPTGDFPQKISAHRIPPTEFHQQKSHHINRRPEVLSLNYILGYHLPALNLFVLQMKLRVSLFSLLSILFVSQANAQEVDSLISRTLDPVVVTAERDASTLSSSTAGVSVLSARELQALPNRNAASLLGFLPGITVLDFDGLGYAPQSVTRGFYGGGEAEYVIVMLNGKPINNLENGLVNWEAITNAPNTTIEVLRGGASSFYGDAAIGAVLNVRTEAPLETTRRFKASTGTYGVRTAQASLVNSKFSILGDFNTSEGFRDHSARTTGTLQGLYVLTQKANRSLEVSASANFRDFETPGPLRSSDATDEGAESLLFFRFDGTKEQTYRATLDGSWGLDLGQITASVSGHLRNQDLTRTLPLSAEFADTQERKVDASGLKASAQISRITLPLSMEHHLTVGMDAFYGSLDTRYAPIATGGIDDTYLLATGEPGDVSSDGTASRTGFAGYAQLELNPTPKLNVSFGARADWINDSFEEVAGLSEAVPSAFHSAISPKAGINYRYASSATNVGNLYANVSRSFKAPTLDQLYDLRAFPVPFPPYSIRIANAELTPQEGTSVEVGFYHRILTSAGWSALVSSSAYSIDMTNEIDFSFESFSNVNIGKSSHKGLETGLKLAKTGLGSAFLNYTLQDVTLQKGDNKGSAVKAIPKHAISGGVTAERGPLSASIVVKGLRKMFVDDANALTLPNYTTVDARVAFTRNAFTLSLDVFNALNKQFNSTAYPDPGGSDVLFIFPAALRTVSVGLEVTL